MVVATEPAVRMLVTASRPSTMPTKLLVSPTLTAERNLRMKRSRMIRHLRIPPPLRSHESPYEREKGGRGVTTADSADALSCPHCSTPFWRRGDVGNIICNACCLYYKLHGTHRPSSMKKIVIKRRKRVPAASWAGASSNTSLATNARLTEQAAAEALVSVSCVQERASGEDSGAGDEEDKGEGEPRRKRGASGNTAASLARRKSTRTKVSTREPTPEDKDDEDNDADAGSKRGRKGSQRDILAKNRAGSLSRSSSRAAFHMD